jgi:hypothetical protein
LEQAARINRLEEKVSPRNESSANDLAKRYHKNTTVYSRAQTPKTPLLKKISNNSITPTPSRNDSNAYFSDPEDTRTKPAKTSLKPAYSGEFQYKKKTIIIFKSKII